MSKKASKEPAADEKPVESSYDLFAPIPVAQTQEVNSDSVWALFEDVNRDPAAGPKAYAKTAVAPLPDLLPEMPTLAQSLHSPLQPGPPSFEATELGGPELLPEQHDAESTSAMGLEELPTQARIDHEMAIIAGHHPRIAKAINVFWGHKGCTEYIEELILNGGDGAGNSRVGFKREVLSALINLSSLHTLK